jgi:hypothetical protein
MMVWDGVMSGTYEDRLGQANDIMIYSNLYAASSTSIRC